MSGRSPRRAAFVVDVGQDNAGPRPVLDHDYEIRPCQLEPHEDPARNKAEAEREAQTELQLAVVRRRGGKDSRAGKRALGIGPAPETTSEAANRFYGVAEASDACSAARVTQALRRCSPLIAPVTLRTLPAPHEGSCTKAIS